MPSLIVKCRRFLYRNANVVDFLGASLLICLCFIILLPKVHESFHHPHTSQEHSHDHQPTQNHDHHHHHHHDHQLPIGEVLVCAGFFAFYCIGLSVGGYRDDELTTNAIEKEPLLSSKNNRKISTVCCSSTRCPTDQRDSSSLKMYNISPTKSKLSLDELVSESLKSDNDEEDCVFNLNRHHNHHTHTRHHEHPVLATVDTGETTNSRVRDNNYGSLIPSKNELDNITPTSAKGSLVVEQTTITTESVPSDDETPLDWPMSLKVTLFGVVLAVALAVLDMNIHGIIEAFKVFKAAATGALLYVSFILVLPKGPAGCNACAKEEI